MDENNNNGVNYGPDPIGGSNTNPMGTEQYVNPNQQPPVYDAVNGGGEASNGMATASMICGIISVIPCCYGCIALILAIVAIVLSITGKKKADEAGQKKAKAGLICGIIGVVINIVVLIAYFILQASGAMSSSSYYYGY